MREQGTGNREEGIVDDSKAAKRDWLVTLIVAVTGGLLVAAIWRVQQTVDGYEMYLVANVIGLFFVPVLVILSLGREPALFGFGLGDSRKVWKIALGLFAALFLFVLLPESRSAQYQDYYPIFRHFTSYVWGPDFQSHSDRAAALAYGWVSYGVYMFFWEFFFRGYLLFGLSRKLGWWAVLVQALAFMFLHIGKPWPEVVASFPTGIILGMVALRARSFVPGFFLHWGASVAFDVLCMWR